MRRTLALLDRCPRPLFAAAPPSGTQPRYRHSRRRAAKAAKCPRPTGSQLRFLSRSPRQTASPANRSGASSSKLARVNRTTTHCWSGLRGNCPSTHRVSQGLNLSADKVARPHRTRSRPDAAAPGAHARSVQELRRVTRFSRPRRGLSQRAGGTTTYVRAALQIAHPPSRPCPLLRRVGSTRPPAVIGGGGDSIDFGYTRRGCLQAARLHADLEAGRVIIVAIALIVSAVSYVRTALDEPGSRVQ